MGDKPALHVIALPHTELTDAFSWCAFTQLCRNFCTMMKRQGYRIVLYGGRDNDCKFDEAIQCHPSPGSTAPTIPDWTGWQFQSMNDWAIEALHDRLEPDDVICLSMGASQAAIVNEFPDHRTVEYAVGYPGTFARRRVFPSYAWQHCVYAQQAEAVNCVNGNALDAVIPHFLDVTKWPKGRGDGGYLAFVARQNVDKGPRIALTIAEALDVPLKVAGFGEPPAGSKVEYVGVLTPAETAELVGGAAAVLCPTLYTEPFNLVAAEAQMCGTPVLTTDWGAFVETVEHGRTGYRSRELVAALDAVRDMLNGKYDRAYIRQRARELWSLEAVGKQYSRYFRGLDNPRFEW